MRVGSAGVVGDTRLEPLVLSDPSWLKLVRTGPVVDAVEGLALAGRQRSAAQGWASAICSQAARRNCADGQAWSLATAATCVTPVVITPGHQQDVARRDHRVSPASG